jgi:hypothetical protein
MLRSWNTTRARDGVPPLLFLYVTVKSNMVAGVPLEGDTAPLDRVTTPQVAESAKTGPAKKERDATSQAASANAPPTPVLVLRAWCFRKRDSGSCAERTQLPWSRQYPHRRCR